MQGRIWDLVEINAEVAAHMDDVAHVRWTSAEIDRAIKAAVRASSHIWFEERVDSSHTYAIATQRYALPTTCENVLEIWFDPISANQPRKLVPMSTWRVEGRDLVFLNVYTLYAAKTMHIYHVVRPANLLDIGAADLATTLGSPTVTSATATWVADGVRPGDTFVITTGADAGTYYVVSITNLTTIVLDTNMTANAAGVSFTIAQFTDLPFDYLVHFSMAWLFELAGRNRPGVEVADVVQWANYYRQLADLDLRRNARRPRPVKRYA